MPYVVDPPNKETHVQEESTYGPQRPDESHSLTLFPTGNYLKGYANKIKADLLRIARMYNGREIRIYRPKPDRCPHCMNTVTGEKLSYNCPYCHGTGRLGGWDVLCDCWTYGDIGARFYLSTDLGNSEAEGGNRDSRIIVGAPCQLQDQDVIVFKGNTDVEKIYDAEPFMITMQGNLIAQAVSTSGITPGSNEFYLADWRKDGAETIF